MIILNKRSDKCTVTKLESRMNQVSEKSWTYLLTSLIPNKLPPILELCCQPVLHTFMNQQQQKMQSDESATQMPVPKDGIGCTFLVYVKDGCKHTCTCRHEHNFTSHTVIIALRFLCFQEIIGRFGL